MRVCLFDLYGTLIDLGGVERAVPAGWDGQTLASLWRAKQLEYSWTYTIMGSHPSFEALAERALDWTMARLSLDDAQARSSLLEAYAHLAPHPDAEPCLRDLQGSGNPCAVLSNGSTKALEHVLTGAGLAPLIDAVISVQPVGAFKPDRRVLRIRRRPTRC